MKKILAIFLLVLVPTVVNAFTETSSTPPNGNAPLPLNTSSTTQTKQGALVSDSYMQADIFYDRYNSGYYVQPRGTNRLNYVLADNVTSNNTVYAAGEVRGAYFRDANNGSYYLNPNSVSILNDVRANIYYDRGNTSYYMNLAANSRFNGVYANTLYSYGYANVRNIYLRDVGRWASDIGRIVPRSYSLPIGPGWSYRRVNAQYCAMGGNNSWTFGVYDLDAISCGAVHEGGTRWRLQGIANDFDRPGTISCYFNCVNP